MRLLGFLALTTTYICYVGHSLGGAMANLAAVDMAQMMQWASIQVYTVGAPRTGNHAYAKLYNKLVPDTWGIINYRVGLSSKKVTLLA